MGETLAFYALYTGPHDCRTVEALATAVSAGVHANAWHGRLVKMANDATAIRRNGGR